MLKFILMISLLATAAQAQIRDSFQAIQNYSEVFPYEAVLQDSRNITEAELGLLLARLNHELNLLPDQQRYEASDLKEIDLLIQLVASRMINKSYYTDVVELDRLVSKKLYGHPLYMELWIYQLHRSYLLARRGLEVDERIRERGDMLAGRIGQHIKDYMTTNQQISSRNHTVSFDHYGNETSLLSEVRSFITELTYYEKNPETGLYARPSKLILAPAETLIISEDLGSGSKKPNARLKPSSEPLVCKDLFDVDLILPEFPSSRRLN